MIPTPLRRPTVGLMPTIPFTADGLVTEPSVSVPIAPPQRHADTATPDPELEIGHHDGKGLATRGEIPGRLESAIAISNQDTVAGALVFVATRSVLLSELKSPTVTDAGELPTT